MVVFMYINAQLKNGGIVCGLEFKTKKISYMNILLNYTYFKIIYNIRWIVLLLLSLSTI